MTSMKKNLLSAAACALMGLASSAQAGVIIDKFIDPVGGWQEVTTISGTDFNQSGPFSTANVIGGYRDLSVTKLSGDAPGETSMTVYNGKLSFNNDTSVTGKGVITWDGSNSAGAGGSSVAPLGLGGIDLTSGGAADQFLVDVFTADLGFNYSISLWDMDGDRSTLSAGVQFQVNSTITTNYLFYWFNLPTGEYCNGTLVPPDCTDPTTELQFGIDRPDGEIDFTRIGAIQLTLQGARADVDMAIGMIRTVPEPATLGLVGLALLGVGAMGRRSSRKS